MTTRVPGPAGFSVVELLVASALVLVVTLIACSLAVEAQVVWRADSARIDLHQRARVAADVLTRALREAGGGPQSGPARGSLLRVLPPIVPRRTGARRPDAPDVFRRDAFTLLRAAADAEAAILLRHAPPGVSVIGIAPASSCGLPSCGVAPGDSVLLADGRGNYDTFTVAAADGMSLTVRHHGAGTVAAYPAGSPVIKVEPQVFSLDGASRILRVYDGDAGDLPSIDDVVGMEVEYYGTQTLPRWPRPPRGEGNCLYGPDGTFTWAPLLLPLESAAPARLPPERLTDGPWCGSGSTAFDADLLRIRRVRVRLRLQAFDPAVRGGRSPRFAVPGTATSEVGSVPDVALQLDIAPRNLEVGW